MSVLTTEVLLKYLSENGHVHLSEAVNLASFLWAFPTNELVTIHLPLRRRWHFDRVTSTFDRSTFSEYSREDANFLRYLTINAPDGEPDRVVYELHYNNHVIHFSSRDVYSFRTPLTHRVYEWTSSGWHKTLRVGVTRTRMLPEVIPLSKAVFINELARMFPVGVYPFRVVRLSVRARDELKRTGAMFNPAQMTLLANALSDVFPTEGDTEGYSNEAFGTLMRDVDALA